MNWRKLFGVKKPPCSHPQLYSYQELSKASICEPGKDSRDILVRILSFKCCECDNFVRIFPRGVAHDPGNGIFRDEKEPDRTEEIDVPEDVRKEVMEYQY